MRESVAKVKEASLPTGKVDPSSYSVLPEMRSGSAKGLAPGIVVGAIVRNGMYKVHDMSISMK